MGGRVRMLQKCWILLSIILPGIFSSEWTVRLPSSSVCARAGSSVVIPCSYDYPRSPPLGEEGGEQPLYRVLSEMWCLGEGRCITPRYVYHSAGIFPEPSYRSRVEFLGELGSGNCSLRISDLRTSDCGIYVFYFITSHSKEKLPTQPGVKLLVADHSSEDALVTSCEDTVGVTQESMTGPKLAIIMGVATAVLVVILVIVACVRRKSRSCPG